MSYENDEGVKVQNDRRQHITTSKSQSLSIFIISSFTTTLLAINCSSIICYSISSILAEGEYRPSLKDCLIRCGSLSEAPLLHLVKPDQPRLCGPSTTTSNTTIVWTPLCTSLSRSLSAPCSLLGRRRRNKRRCLHAGTNNSPNHGPSCFNL
jgi:hypothetical protein